MNNSFTVGSSTIGVGCPTYIVAEISANHGGSFDKAEELIHKASQAGADAVKLQTYTADTMTIDSRKDRFVHRSDSPWAGLSLYELYEKAYTPWEWHEKLKKSAEELGMELFSSPFDVTSVDFLDSLNVPAYKIASFEIIDLPLIEYAASKGKPLIISTGMASLSEIHAAISCAKKAGCKDLALLKCVSSYPATYTDMNLATIPHMSQTFQCSVGLSDHSKGITAPLIAVALGAIIIEKHFTLSKNYSTLDKNFSLDPKEFSDMARAIRNGEKCIGSVTYDPQISEEESESFRRSLYITENLKKGDELTVSNCRSIRPGGGLKPHYIKMVLGKKLSKDAPKGTPLSWDLLLQ